MAKHDYSCRDCGSLFEIERSIFQPVTQMECPKCRSGNTAKVFTPPNLNLFSGSSPSQQELSQAFHAVRETQPFDGGGVSLENCLVENGGTGIHAEGARITGKRVTLHNNERGIVGINSEFDIDGLVIN